MNEKLVNSGYLDCSDGNRIYWETSGNPKGQPALFLHGGPGAGLKTGHRKYFDKEKYFLVSLDQRGCGRSKPLISSPEVDLSTFTTDAIIEDIEKLRNFLQIKKWLVSGVSWGSNLALAYALKYPKVVSQMVLAAVTTGTKKEIEWITEDLSYIFPKEWASFSSFAKKKKEQRLIDAYYDKITSSNLGMRAEAAEKWCQWEDTHISLGPDFSPYPGFKDQSFREIFATYVIHFWKHNVFLEDSFVSDLKNISDIPTTLIHGKHDISCPLKFVYDVHNQMNNSKLVIIDSEGHGGRIIFEEFFKATSSYFGTTSLKADE